MKEKRFIRKIEYESELDEVGWLLPTLFLGFCWMYDMLKYGDFVTLIPLLLWLIGYPIVAFLFARKEYWVED